MDGEAAASGGIDAPTAVAGRGDAVAIEISPPRAAGRRRAEFVALITNTTQASIEVRMSVVSRDGAVRGAIVPAVLELAPRGRRTAVVELRPRRPLLGAGERAHRVAVRARAADGEAARGEVVFVQRRWPPLWAQALALVAALVAVYAFTRLPERVTVPTVEGAADVASAQRTLNRAGLALHPVLRARTTDVVRPGVVLGQTPRAGTEVARGEEVVLVVAVGSRRVQTPAVQGEPRARALALLRAAGLTEGTVLPPGAPADGVVARQLPPAGQRVAAGTVATLFLRPRSSADTAHAGGPAGTSPARAGGGGTRTGAVAGGALTTPGPARAPAAGSRTTQAPSLRAAVPARGGLSAAGYARAVAAAGLVPKLIRAVDPAPRGTLVAVRPAPGTVLGRGTTVRLIVAAGIPRLAFDIGEQIRVYDPRSGRTAVVASPPGRAAEPSWTADGRQVLYRAGRRLLLASARGTARPRVVYDGDVRLHGATVAPSAGRGAVALVRTARDDGDLCFAQLRRGTLRPRCVREGRWNVRGPISWRPDGRELLVYGVRRGHPRTFGILRYRTRRPFSTNPGDWRWALATDASRPGQGAIAAAFSPSGRNVGLVTNVGLDRFRVLVTPAGGLRDPAAAPLPLRACAVAWRPDGEELAVVQADAACRRPRGRIVRVEAKRPHRAVVVAGGARHPAYQPLTYAGPALRIR